MKNISDEIELKNRKSNPFGWSQSETWYNGKHIGFIECGGFFMNKGYTYTEKEDCDTTYVEIFEE